MHCVLQFISGLGPRKAKRLINRIKALPKKLPTRGEIFRQLLLAPFVYVSAVPFMKIRLPMEEILNGKPFDVLDSTRIHHERYNLAMKIATDACQADGDSTDDKPTQLRYVRDVIADPSKLNNLDLK